MPDQILELSKQQARLEEKVIHLGREISGMRHEMKTSMDSIQQTLSQLALFNERLVNNAKEHEHIHQRINTREREIVELGEAFENVEKHLCHHKDAHCQDCENEEKIGELLASEEANTRDIKEIEDRLKVVEGRQEKYLPMTEIVFTRTGQFVLENMFSKVGAVIAGIIALDVALNLYAHRELLVKFINFVTLK